MTHPLNDLQELGQIIPLHYHYQMLSDGARMSSFHTAINALVKPGSVVLELGSGTGVLSFFAAEKARKVFAVELNPDLAEESRRLLGLNAGGERVEVIRGDAFEYIPPEPVDVVICEMLHVGLLREKQLAVIDSFKRRYRQRFGEPLPAFIPEAVIQAIQPVSHDFRHEGYFAPIPLFQDQYSVQPRTRELGAPVVYHQLLYSQPFELTCKWEGDLPITSGGNLNALRVITKNILAIMPETRRTTDWHLQYLILPLERETPVRPGQTMKGTLEYTAGAPLSSLQPLITGPHESSMNPLN